MLFAVQSFFVLCYYVGMKDDTFDAVILDIDGTIWNTTSVVADAWNEAIRKSGIDAGTVDAERLKAEFGKTMDVIADDLWPSLSMAQKEKLLSFCCSEEQAWLESNTKDIAYPAVIDTIRSLSERVKLYIVSNCQNGYIELTMAKNNISSYISDFECYGRTGKGKADNLKLLISRNGIHNPLYVGDTQGDCDACRDAGVKFVWASYGFGKASDFYKKIRSFDELEEFV